MKKLFIIALFLFSFFVFPVMARAEMRPPTTLEKIALSRRQRVSAYIERISRSLSSLADYDDVLLARIDLAIEDRAGHGEDTYRPAAFAMSAHSELAEGATLLASTTSMLLPARTDEALQSAKTLLEHAEDRIKTAHLHIGEAIASLQ